MKDIAYLGCLLLVAYAAAGPIKLPEVATSFISKVEGDAEALLQDYNKLDVCPNCVSFAKDTLNELLEIVLNVGVIGSCNELCDILAQEVGEKGVAVVCSILCDIVGVKEFIKEIKKADLDPIYYCELIDICPINDNGDAQITQLDVVPSSGPQGDFKAELAYTSENGTGTGEINVFVDTVDGIPVGATFLNEAAKAGTYSGTFTVNAVPDPDCDITQGPCEGWLPGTYTLTIALCNGECGSSHPHSQIYDKRSATFEIVKSTIDDLQAAEIYTTNYPGLVEIQLSPGEGTNGLSPFTSEQELPQTEEDEYSIYIPTGVSDGDTDQNDELDEYEDDQYNDLGYDEESIYPKWLDDDYTDQGEEYDNLDWQYEEDYNTDNLGSDEEDIYPKWLDDEYSENEDEDYEDTLYNDYDSYNLVDDEIDPQPEQNDYEYEYLDDYKNYENDEDDLYKDQEYTEDEYQEDDEYEYNDINMDQVQQDYYDDDYMEENEDDETDPFSDEYESDYEDEYTDDNDMEIWEKDYDDNEYVADDEKYEYTDEQTIWPESLD